MKCVCVAIILGCILGISVTGAQIHQCQAVPIDCSQTRTIHHITNTVTNSEKKPLNVSLQAQSLSITLTTDNNKRSYLTGDTININITSNLPGTNIRLRARLANGTSYQIAEFTISGPYTYSWATPLESGQITLICEGSATVMVWTTCPRIICPSGADCYTVEVSCQIPMEAKDTKSWDLRTYSRVTSISGYITDTKNQPINGALVKLSSGRETRSAESGYYKFDNYEISNYELIGDVPTGSETVAVEAVACRSGSNRTKVPAEQSVSNFNFNLQRYFYPASIDLSKFDFSAFANWPEARNHSTWQNIIGITVDDKDIGVTKLQFGGKGTSPFSCDFGSRRTKDEKQSLPSFDIGNKKLYLIPNPQVGRYLIDIKGKQNTAYHVDAEATLSANALKGTTFSKEVKTGGTKRLILVVKPNMLELTDVPEAPPWLLITLSIIGGAAGILVAFLITGDKLVGLRKAFANIKLKVPKKTQQAKKPES